MADYVSTLNGSQMDQALLDMAEHTSEAYAVGERNGVPVGSDDVTYHNNARYYAQQAQSIAPASVTEAVRWDIAQTALTDANKLQARENINAADNDTSVQVVAQTFTSAQQEIARANIAAGSTNPNLIDNPWFTIQQRGTSAFTAAGYTADRWQKQGATGIVTPTANGLKFEKNGATYAEVRYYDTLDKYANAGNGKTFTLSIMLPDGSVQSGQFTMASSGLDTNVYFAISSTNDFRVDLYTTENLFVVRMLIYTDFTLRAVKLELGTVSTLANDTPPDYETELLKCQRYCYVFSPLGYTYPNCGIAIPNSTTTAAYVVTTPVPMRTIPTLTVNGSWRVVDGEGTSRTLSSIAIMSNANQAGGNLIALTLTTSATITVHRPYIFGGLSAGCNLIFSADL